MQPDRQTVRKIGLSYVRNQLSRRGWEGMHPAGNARGVDFLTHTQDGSRKLTIKVRALSRSAAVPLGATLDNLLADYMIVCTKVIEANPECFILRTEEVKDLANRNEKDRQPRYWLRATRLRIRTIRERWDRMGSGAD